MSLPAEQQDRAAGALLGLALGDALGAGYEFGPVVDPVSVGMVGGGPAGWQPGEWTDATAMAICIGRVAAMSPDLDHPVALAAVGEAFGECSARARGAVLGAIRGGSAVGPDRFARASDTGSLVRTAPVALACLGDDDALAEVPKLVSAITHADPIAGEACVVWCAAIDRAVRTGRVDGVHDGPALLRPDRGVFWAGVLAGATRAEPPEVEPDGAAVRALRTAWATIARSDRIPFDEVLRRTVAQGGDGRGVAALVGELLGAARGASTLPFRWSRVLHGWPDWRGGDLVRLGAAIARREGDWTIPWEPGDFPPIAVPLVDDPGVLVGNIEALRVVDADAFVSLCRLRAEQVRPPYHHEVWLVDDANAMAPQNLDAALTQAVEAVATFRAEGRRVFLHCVSGVSRTGAVASLYLARRLGVSGLDALERVRATRPAVAPNAGLLAAIRRLAP